MISKLVRYSLCCLILCAAFGLRIADLHTLPGGIHVDEAGILADAWRISKGYSLPLDFGERPEPFDTLIRGVWMRAAGPTPFASRILSVLLGVLAVAATTAAAHALYADHPHRAWIAAGAGVALAAMPGWAALNRSIYRVNWLPVFEMLALAALAHGWRSGRRRWWALSGACTGGAAIFYMAGLAFLPALALCILWAYTRLRSLCMRNLAAMVAALGLIMLPWLYLFLRIPNWLGGRIDNLPPANPANLMQNVALSLSTLFVSDKDYYTILYNPADTPLLNPALQVLFAVGLAASLWRWRRAWRLAPLIILVMLALPGALSGHPRTIIRLAGMFGPAALVVGLGTGTLLGALKPGGQTLRAVAALVMALVLAGSPVHTYQRLQYFYRAQPELYADPGDWYSFNAIYKLTHRDLLHYMAGAGQPVYTSIEHMNQVAMAWLRPQHFPHARPYRGEALPAGRVVLTPTAQPNPQYVLLLPASGEIVILPPLTEDLANALYVRVREEGAALYNDAGWYMGDMLPITTEANPFDAVLYPPPAPAGDIGSFDDTLTLAGIAAPHTLTPGEPVSVTLYWRLEKPTGTDYFSFVQLFDSAGVGWDSSHTRILHWIYPTVLWQPGDIVPETRRLPVAGTLGSGAYQYLVGVYTQPGKVPVPVRNAIGTQEPNNWLVAGRAAVPPPPAPPPPPDALHIDAPIGEAITLTHAAIEPPPHMLAPGDTLHITLYWRASGTPPEDYVAFVHLVDHKGAVIAQQDTPPPYPTGVWLPGERFTTTYTLHIPAETPAADFAQLYAGLYRWPTLERLPTTGGDTVLLHDWLY